MNIILTAERSPASIFIFNIPRRQFVASYRRRDDRIVIKTLTYSKITGELLVNVIRRGENCTGSLMLAKNNVF